ncbi:endonuclease III [Sulfolobus sp. B5]|nr:endonuclease III [Sulfolobus sp. B5]
MTCKADFVYYKLEREYTIKPEEYIAYYVWLKYKDCFKVLVSTILSQKSTDKSALKAYMNLETNIGVNVINLAESPLNSIEESIKVSGLYKSKAKRIKEISSILLNQYKGDINIILASPNAREVLLSFNGIGEKTADVVLLTCKGERVFPVDTHISRVTKRLGLVSISSKYREISQALMNYFSNYDFLKLHHLLIAHGRTVCKAKKPLCQICVIKECCEYYSNRARKSEKSSTT